MNYERGEFGVLERRRKKQKQLHHKLKLKTNLRKLKKEQGILENTDKDKDTDTNDVIADKHDVVKNDVIVLDKNKTLHQRQLQQLHRQETKSKHLKKTRKGQPILQNQIDLILSKLKSS